MKTLLVDDSNEKLAALRRILDEHGVLESDVHVALNGIEARNRLRANRYELVVVDMALPLREGDAPDREGGFSLLNEVCTRDIYQKPTNVVGLSAYSEICEQWEAWFRDRLWHLLHYDPSASAWSSRIGKLIAYLHAAAHAPTPYSTDLCVVTALSTPELDAILQLPWSWGESTLMDPSNFVYRGEVPTSGEPLSVVAATVGRSGMVPASILATKVLSAYRPRFLIMGGICAGVRGKVQLGDVIVASIAWDWQYGKLITKEGRTEFLIEPVQFNVPSYVIAQFSQFKADQRILSSIGAKWTKEKPNEPALHVGPIASGAAVVADEKVLGNVREQQRALLGIDMEAFGVYAAGHYGPYPHPTTFCIKGVSDYADEKKNDRWHAYAAFTSASVLAHFVETRLTSICNLAGTL